MFQNIARLFHALIKNVPNVQAVTHVEVLEPNRVRLTINDREYDFYGQWPSISVSEVDGSMLCTNDASRAMQKAVNL